MPSESDLPFTSFTWIGAAKPNLTIARLLELAGHAPDTVVDVVDLGFFFRNVAADVVCADLRAAHMTSHAGPRAVIASTASFR